MPSLLFDLPDTIGLYSFYDARRNQMVRNYNFRYITA